MARKAVVVGSGPNGLAAAIALARAGLEVVVHEAAPEIGGGVRTDELTLPGFRHDVCSAIHPLARWSFDLDVEWIESPACLAHPLDDDEAVLLLRDVDETASGLDRDADAYRQLIAPYADAARLRDPLRALRSTGVLPLLRGLGRAAALARRTFSTARGRAFFAGNAAHSMLPLETRPTAGFGLALLALGHAVGWPFPRGGAAAIGGALAARLRELGGEIVVSSRVDHLPRADVVMCDVTPRELLRLARFPERYERALRRYRYGPGAFKLDWALGGPIPWRDSRCAQAATLHLGGTLEEIAASERAPGGTRPFVILAQPSPWDDTRAPAGKHTAWAYCHVPNGSAVDMTDAVEAQVARFAPGFGALVLARNAMGPRELETHNGNLVGGDINGGLMDLRQLCTRPTRSLVPYRTPLRGVYICSASTPPGGGVHGMCGSAAAKVALHDLATGAAARMYRRPRSRTP